MTKTDRKIRWGIAGLGKVAQRFANDLTKHIDNAELYAVAARDPNRAASFGAIFECEQTYGSYADLARDSSVDIVYIASIHPLHKSMVELFLNHGKHVLVEKPAFTNTEHWDQMASLAEKKGLLLVEAMKTIVFPAYQKLRRFIQDNSVIIDSLEASFGNHHEYHSNKQLFSPKLSGGSTLDTGVYAIWLYADLCNLMQADIPYPSARFYSDNICSEVDENVELNFSGTINAKLRASITRDLPREAIIKGPQLEIIIKDKWWNPKNIDITYKGVKQSISIAGNGGGFEHEIEHISSLVLEGKCESDLLPGTCSRKVIAIMERCLQEGGFSHLVESTPTQ